MGRTREAAPGLYLNYYPVGPVSCASFFPKSRDERRGILQRGLFRFALAVGQDFDPDGQKVRIEILNAKRSGSKS